MKGALREAGTLVVHGDSPQKDLKPGRKTVQVTISDGIEEVVKEWEISVLSKTKKVTTAPTTTTTPVITEPEIIVTPTKTYKMTTYVIEG